MHLHPYLTPKICADNHARLILPFRGKSTLFATLNMQENEIDEIEITKKETAWIVKLHVYFLDCEF